MSGIGDDGIVSAAGLAGVPGQGPHMIILLRVRAGDGVIAGARFSAYKCPAAQACGQWVTEAVEGKRLAEAAALTEQDVIAGAGAMPLGREHCPKLAIDALQSALAEGYAAAASASSKQQ